MPSHVFVKPCPYGWLRTSVDRVAMSVDAFRGMASVAVSPNRTTPMRLCRWWRGEVTAKKANGGGPPHMRLADGEGVGHVDDELLGVDVVVGADGACDDRRTTKHTTT
jgi:hypothetical protein